MFAFLIVSTERRIIRVAYALNFRNWKISSISVFDKSEIVQSPRLSF